MIATRSLRFTSRCDLVSFTTPWSKGIELQIRESQGKWCLRDMLAQKTHAVRTFTLHHNFTCRYERKRRQHQKQPLPYPHAGDPVRQEELDFLIRSLLEDLQELFSAGPHLPVPDHRVVFHAQTHYLSVRHYCQHQPQIFLLELVPPWQSLKLFWGQRQIGSVSPYWKQDYRCVRVVLVYRLKALGVLLTK